MWLLIQIYAHIDKARGAVWGLIIVRSAKRYDDLALLAVSARPISRVRIFPG